MKKVLALVLAVIMVCTMAMAVDTVNGIITPGSGTPVTPSGSEYTIVAPGSDSGLVRDSIVLLEQIRTIDKRRLKERMGRLDDTSMAEIDTALTISFGLGHGTT